MARPDQKEYTKLQWILERVSTAEDYCRPYFERAKRHYRLYRFGSAVDASDWPYVNRVRTRDILAFVEDTAAMMVQSLMGQYPFYAVLPRRESQLMKQVEGIDPSALGRQIETCLNYQIAHEDTEFFEEMLDYFKEGGIFGTSYSGVYPKFENNTYVRPIIKTTGFWDVMPIPGARRMSRSRGVFVREFMAREEAEELVAKVNIDKSKRDEITRQLKGFVSGNSDERRWHEDLLAQVGIENYNPDDKDVEILHYFSGGHVISMADRAVIIRDSNEPVADVSGQQHVIKPFPYDLPVVQYKYMPVPLEYFGMGIPEALEGLQEDKNLVRSSRRDNIDLVINKILLTKDGPNDLNYDLLKYYAGAVWPNTLGYVEPLEMQDVTQSSYREEEAIRFDMENALSMFGYARGMTPTHEERPTTVIKLQQAAMNRVDLAIKLAEFTAMQNIASRVVLLTRRYMPQQLYEAIVGEQDAGFYRLTEEQIRLFYMFKPLGSSVTHVKEIRQQQLAFAAQILEKVAPISTMNVEPFTINWLEATKTALESVDIRNIDSLLIPLRPQQQQGPMMQQGMASPGNIQSLQNIPYGTGGYGSAGQGQETV